MMDTRKAALLAVALLFCLLMGGAVGAVSEAPLQTPAVDWWVIGAGGDDLGSAPYALDGTIGQALVGTMGDRPSFLCAGFWCGTGAAYRVYLPLVLRQN